MCFLRREIKNPQEAIWIHQSSSRAVSLSIFSFCLLQINSQLCCQDITFIYLQKQRYYRGKIGQQYNSSTLWENVPSWLFFLLYFSKYPHLNGIHEIQNTSLKHSLNTYSHLQYFHGWVHTVGQYTYCTLTGHFISLLLKTFLSMNK